MSCKAKENEVLPSKTKDVTSISDDKKTTLRSSKKKDSNEVVKDFTSGCLKFVDDLEDDMENDTDIEIVRQKYFSCTEKIEQEVIAQNVVVDFGLKLMLSNMKLVNENTNRDMIRLKVINLRRGLSDFKLKQENDGKK